MGRTIDGWEELGGDHEQEGRKERGELDFLERLDLP